MGAVGSRRRGVWSAAIVFVVVVVAAAAEAVVVVVVAAIVPTAEIAHAAEMNRGEDIFRRKEEYIFCGEANVKAYDMIFSVLSLTDFSIQIPDILPKSQAK